MNVLKYVLIAIGGILGANLRYLIEGVHISGSYHGFPVNTFLINIAGSFILALVLTIAFEIWEYDASLRLGIATGFLGAFTTFSTLCKETVILFYQGNYAVAAGYVGGSAVIGCAAAFLGIIVAREFIAKQVRKNEDNDTGALYLKGGEE